MKKLSIEDTKKVTLLVLFLVLVSFVGLVFFSIQQRKQAQPSSKNISEENYNPENPVKVDSYPITSNSESTLLQKKVYLGNIPISGNLDEFTPPKTFTTTQFSPTEVSFEDLQTSFSLVKRINEDTFSDQWENTIVSYDKYSDRYIYSYEAPRHSHNDTLVTFDMGEIEQAAEVFVREKLGNKSSLLMIQETNTMISDGFHFEEATGEQGTHIEVVYKYQIADNFGNVSFKNNYPPVRLYLDSDLEVTKADFFADIYIPTNDLIINSMSLKDSINQNGYGYIDVKINSSGNRLIMEDIVGIEIISTTINYHIDSETGLTYPMYVTEAKVQTSEGAFDTEISIPAIQTTIKD